MHFPTVRSGEKPRVILWGIQFVYIILLFLIVLLQALPGDYLAYI